MLAGPAHTVREVVELIAGMAGRPMPPLWPGPRGMRTLAGTMRLLGRFVPLPTMLAAETLRSIAGTTYIGSGAKAQRELGFEARTIAIGMRETLLAEARALGLDDIVSRLEPRAATPATRQAVQRQIPR